MTTNLQMKFSLKAYFIIILILLVGVNSNGQTTKKVLFLGNSYTGVNNLPSMVSQAATSAGDVLVYDSHTPGGERLMGHASNATAIAKIASNNWDLVVLQAQSQEPSWDTSQTNVEVFPYAEILSDTIRYSNACANPMFYMTWGRKNGDASNCANLSWVCTYDGMDSALRVSYTYMAAVNKGEVSPVGPVWHYIRDNYPEIELYDSDESHPSVAGSYAAACAFYTTIFDKDPSLITWQSTLDRETAENIRLAAKLVAFDSLQYWDYTDTNVSSDFGFAKSMNVVNFSNQVQYYDSLRWDFGDGQFSSAINPSHSYAASGNYDVTLKIYLCNNIAEETKTISIDSVVGINNSVENMLEVRIYPNPVSDIINIEFSSVESNSYTMCIYNSQGKLVTKENAKTKNNNIHQENINELASGVYFLQIVSNGKSFSRKILKN